MRKTRSPRAAWCAGPAILDTKEFGESVPVTAKPLEQWEAAGLTQGDGRYSTPLYSAFPINRLYSTCSYLHPPCQA